MGFLEQFTKYHSVCIQCHDNPDADAIASAFAAARFLESRGVQTRIVYGGAVRIQKNDLKIMIRECGIPVEYAEMIEPAPELLLLVDCQRGNGNVFPFEAERIGIIDHHLKVVEDAPTTLIKTYQSCSAILWELLSEEGYPLDDALSVALLYGLYTDTSKFTDLYSPQDTAMKTALSNGLPLFERLTKSGMTVAELLIAGDALLHHYLDFERRFAIVEALKCDQTMLGAINDLVICVDVICLSFVYCQTANGYQISLRSCHETIRASDAVKVVCDGIGSGGGHANKAGGFLSKEKIEQEYGTVKIFDLINRRLCEYVDGIVENKRM